MANSDKHLIVVGGATASGKTEASIRLAEYFGAEVISADSRQFYREMNIGTAKPTAAEQKRAVHHFVDSLSVTDPYSVGDFERDAILLIEQLHQKHDYVVMAGGSGLFINAVCEGLDTFPDIPDSVKTEVEQGFQQNGLTWLQEQVQMADPVYFGKVDRQNPARLRRALEVIRSSGKPFSDYTKGDVVVRPFKIHQIMTDWPRDLLYGRINQRVDRMLEEGLEDEARTLLPYRNLPALNTVGYEEFFMYFDGQLNYSETMDKIKQHTRNYAKRQLTWFRKYGNWETFNAENFEKILHYLEHRTQN